MMRFKSSPCPDSGDDSGSSRGRPDRGHIALVAVIIGYIGWYIFDAHAANSRLENLILILPLGLVGIGLGLWLIVKEIRGDPAQKLPTGGEDKDGVEEGPKRTPLILALLGLYVLGMAYVGFDVATFLFMISCLWATGLRSIPLILCFSLAFTFVTVVGMGQLVSMPELTVLEGFMP